MKIVRLGALIVAAVVLAGCAADNYVPKAEPSMYHSLAQPGAQLDEAAAASMISGYRANNNLPAVTLDPGLTSLAQARAELWRTRQARSQRQQALRRAAEGVGLRRQDRGRKFVGASYHTLAEAFSGWRGHPAPRQHAAQGRDALGIAAVYTAALEVQGVLG